MIVLPIQRAAAVLLPLVVVIGAPGYRRPPPPAIVRLALVLLLILADSVQHNADQLAVVGRSDSRARDAILALEFVRTHRAHDGDQAAVIVFGADALVETPGGQLSDPVRLNTDLAEAMRLGTLSGGCRQDGDSATARNDRRRRGDAAGASQVEYCS